MITVSLLQSVDGAPLTRITALDAAGPGFWSTVPGQLPPRPRPLAPPAPPQQRLDRGDAELVQAIHTNTGNMGARPRLGHLDLYIGGAEAGAGTTDHPHSVCCAGHTGGAAELLWGGAGHCSGHVQSLQQPPDHAGRTDQRGTPFKICYSIKSS